MPGLLVVHVHKQNGRAMGGEWHWKTTAYGGEPRTYRMEFPTNGGPWNCPVKRCPGRFTMRTAMRVHFFCCHVRDTIIILEEVNLPHPWCSQCEMQVPWSALSGRHLLTAQCERERRGSENGWQRRSCGRLQRGPSRPMVNRRRRSRCLRNWDGS